MPQKVDLTEKIRQILTLCCYHFVSKWFLYYFDEIFWQCDEIWNRSELFGKIFVKSIHTVILWKLHDHENSAKSTVKSDWSTFLWKNEKKFAVIEKIFRQINSLVFLLVNALLSRNFCQTFSILKIINESVKTLL